MKPSRRWLAAALRAQQVRLSTDMLSSQRAQKRLTEEDMRLATAEHEAARLLTDWRRLRGASPNSFTIDAAYARFEVHLQGQRSDALRQQETCRRESDQATQNLRQSHAMHERLDKLAQQAEQEAHRARVTTEMRQNAEAWLLGQVSRPSTSGPDAGRGLPRDMESTQPEPQDERRTR